MIVCVNGEGQGCCDLCKIINGWHRHWSSSLYYVVNTKNQKLVYDFDAQDFTFKPFASHRVRNAVFCHLHAHLVDDSRSQYTDY